MVTQNMKAIIDKYNLDTKNMFANNAKPQVNYDFSKQKTLNGNWVNSWNPTTANKTAKAALTSIKNNQGVSTKSWWQNTLHGLGAALDYIDRARNTVDNAFNEYLKGQSQGQRWTNLNPIAEIYNGLQKGSNGKTNFANAWEGAKRGFTGQDKTHYEKILDTLGWKVDKKDKSVLGKLNKFAHATVGFAGDVATDPLTYLTFGGESVIKSAAKPFVKQAEEFALKQGAKKGTEAFQLAKDSFLSANRDTIEAAIKTAQAKANNSLVSIGAPFGKKINLVNKPSFMKKQTQLISKGAAEGMADMMRKAGIADNASRYDLLSHLVGRKITSTKQLNTQEYDFINQVWHDGLDQSVTKHYNPSNLPDPFGGVLKPSSKAPKSEWENFVNTHWQNVMGQPLPTPASQMTKSNLKNLSKHLYNHLEQVRGNNYNNAIAQAMGNIKNDFTAMGKTFTHYQGLTGVSPATKKLFVKSIKNGEVEATKLGKGQEYFGKLFGSRRFVPLTTKITDHRIAGGLGHAINSGNKAYAYSHDMISKLKDIAKLPEFKALNADDWREVAYAIEGKRPTFAGYVPPSPAKQAQIDHIAKLLTGDPNNPASTHFLKELTDIEQAAGIPYTVRQNYFPHVYNTPNEMNFNELTTQLENMGQQGKKIAAGLRNSMSGFQRGRTNFQSMADLADALHLAEQTGNTKFLDMYKNVSWNPLEAFGKRAISGMHQVAKREAVNNILKDGLALDAKQLDGWVRPEDMMVIPDGSPLEMLKGKLIPKEIATDVSKINKLLTNDAELNNFVDKADHILGILRRNYTVTKVGFHVRQSIGNIFQNTLAGVNASSYTHAIKYLKNPDKYPQWTKELLENGIIHTGTSGADLANNLGEELSTRLLDKVSINPVGQNFFLAKAGRAAGEWEDNVARAAHYMYMRGKGLTQEQAADSVRKYLFNYSEISTAGQWWRRVIPFYQWMRNNLPFQIANTIKNPKVYNITQNLLYNYQDRPSDQEAMKLAGINNPLDQEIAQKLIEENGGTLPKYIQDNYIKTPWGYYSIGLPVQDLKQVTHDPAAYFFGGMNPYLSLIMRELPSNESALNGAQIDKSVPKGSSIWTSGGGINRVLETGIGSPYQIGEGIYGGLTGGDWSNVQKGFGTKTQEADPAKTINNLLYQKALEMNTKAKLLKGQNGGN